MNVRRVAILVLIILLVAAGMAWRIVQRPKSQTISLPDGSQLTLLKVTHGTNHVCVYGSWWQNFRDAVHGRFKGLSSLRRATFTSTDTNSVMVWLRHDPPPDLQALSPPYLLATADGNDLESKLTHSPNVRVNLRAASGRPGLITSWELPEHPRRAKEFKIRIYRHAAEKLPRLGEFTVRNPISSTFPTWPAELLPATRQKNDLGITLTKLETGLTGEEVGRPQTGEGAKSFSRATFTVKEDGVPAGIWGVTRLSARNAAGEVRRIKTFDSVWQHGERIVTFEGALWSEESAWILEVAFVRHAAFPPEEHWVIKGVPVPSPGELVEMHVVTNLFNVELEFVGVGGTKSKKFGAHTSLRPFANIQVRTPYPMDDLRVALVEVKDEHGTSAILDGFSSTSTVSTGGRGNTPKEMLYEFGFDLSADVKSLDITLAVTRVQHVEFFAKPVLFDSNNQSRN